VELFVDPARGTAVVVAHGPMGGDP
jgi:hypothetical protein